MQHTFVICAYKQSEFLAEAIESCVNQESVLQGESTVILYTSTPNDYITELAEAFQLPLYTKEGGSIGKDWNNALSFVNTTFATIVHQDDLYLPDYGKKVIDAFQKNRQATIVFSDYEENDKDGQIRTRSINLKIKTFGLKLMSLLPWKAYKRRIYAFGNFICCPAVTFNLALLTDFRFNEKMRMAVDWDAWERIMKKNGTVVYLPERLMCHRIHEESETTATTADKTREVEEREMYERYWGKSMTKLLMKFYVQNQKSNKV